MKFRIIKKLVLLSVFFTPVGVLADSVRISDENAHFYYDANADIKTPAHKLAEFISSDYRNARDEFTKHDLFQQIKPVIDKRLAKAKNTKTVHVRISVNLENYDFGKKAFATGIGATTYIPLDNNYAVTFTNAEKIKFLSVPINSARKLSKELGNDRRSNFIIQGVITGAKEESLGRWGGTKKAIKVKITKIEVTLKSGTKVGTNKL